jgi:putative glutamine amidotransferase
MTNPLIGVPTVYDTSAPETMPSRFAMNRVYIDALKEVGAAPVLIPLDLGTETLRAVYERLDGLFMAGGGDIDPLCYRQSAHPATGGIDSLRDETELTLIRWALEDGLPLLGVCRGVQTLNVAAGGTLIQDVPVQVPNAMRHQWFPEKPRDWVAHDIATTRGTRLADILGAESRVNSFHHQAVEQIAPGFKVAAVAPDGVIEAIEWDKSFAIGVQWHPESLIHSDKRMYALFDTFVRAAA